MLTMIDSIGMMDCYGEVIGSFQDRTILFNGLPNTEEKLFVP